MIAFTRRSLLATALVFALLALWPASTPDHAGPAKVIDGGTIAIAGETHRLFGIDAVELDRTCRTPEGKDWSCGREAAAALRAFIGEAEVGCETRGRYASGRHISICRAHGADLAALMAREGQAVAERTAPRLLSYTSEERMARFLRRWRWRSGNEHRGGPWDAAHPAAVTEARAVRRW